MTATNTVAMTMANWDPLDENLSSEVVSATIKRQIRNILKSYTGWFDPLSELIQNSLDAVESRKRQESSYTPTIFVKIDLQANRISITDSGTGFSEDQFRAFLAPNVSFKKSSNRGNKGVGATYLAYGFNHIQVGTKTPTFAFVGSLRQGREWVEDETGTVTRPKIIQDAAPLHEVFTGVDRGSTFTLQLGGDRVRPRDLEWFNATTAEQWGVVLRVKTPLGGVYLKDRPLPVVCQLEVVDKDGTRTEARIESCDYLYPHSIIGACRSTREFQEEQQKLLKSGRDTSKLPQSMYNLNGLYNYWSFEDLIAADGQFGSFLGDDERQLLGKYKVAMYGFIAYSTELWDLYNDRKVGLRKKYRVLRGGLQLATNAMPQGELLVIPLTQNIGYQNVTHVLIHFTEADPDLGRKGFQPELEELAKRLAVRVVTLFLQWRRHLRTDTGAPADIETGKAIHEWIREQEEYERTHPLAVRRDDVFLPTKEISLTSEPLNEQDVVALFNQLLAGGVIRGVRVMSTSQHNQYDGVFRFVLRPPMENHIFDLKKNPLGIEANRVNKEFTSEPRILEYKYNLDALIEELEKGDKVEKDIKLAIAWKAGDEWRKRYQMTPLLHLDNVHLRLFHGATHLVHNSYTGDLAFPAIILSELIDYLNNPEEVQAEQKNRYMGDLFI